MMTLNSNWDYIRKTLASFLFCKEELIDLIAVYPVLELSLFGKSNQYISDTLDLSINDVSTILQEFLGISGSFQNLDFSPIIISEKYNDCDEFMQEMEYMGLYVQTDALYYACKRLKEYKKEIDQFYAKQ